MARAREIGDDEDRAAPPDDRRFPRRLARMRAPGTRGLPDPWTPPLYNDLKLKTALDAPPPALYIEALGALVAEIKRFRSAQRRIDLENGEFEGAFGGRNRYGFPFADEAHLFEDTDVELEALGRRLDATLVSASGGRVVVAIAEDLGPTIKKATLVIDQTALLTVLKDRLQSVQRGQLVANRPLADAVVGNGRPPAVGAPIPPLPVADLNVAQRKAFHAALERRVTYVWGPAGCGKTRTLAPVVRAAFDAEKRVIVCSNTNRAVDQILYKLCHELGTGHPAMRDGRILRLGTIADDKLKRDFASYVTHDGILARLSVDLRRRQDELQAAMAEVDVRVAEARSALERFTELDQQERVVEAAQARVDEAAHEYRSRQRNLSSRRTRLERLRAEQASPGRFFGLFKRKPEKIARDIADCWQQIAELERVIDAHKPHHDKLSAELEPAAAGRDRLLEATAGLDRVAAQVAIETADDTKSSLLTELREIEARLAELGREITTNARILGATCTKTYVSAKSIGQAHLVVVDEASMVMLPALWFCAALAKERVVVCGDFRQIPPIVTTRQQAIVDAIGDDVFAAKKIDNADHPELMMLDQQFRMDDAICRLLSEPMYEGRLVTSPDRKLPDRPRLPAPFDSSLIVVDTSDLWPFESRDAFFSRFNLMHALLVRNIAWHCRNEGALSDGECLGVCTPYTAQARLVRALLKDEGLHQVQVGTVHRFQGDERNAVILDIPESHGGSRALGHFVTGVSPRGEGARLINVALSRAQSHVVVLANLTHLDRELPSSALLREILHRIQEGGRVLSGRDVLALRPLERDLAGLFGAVELDLDERRLGLFDQDNFDPAFEADLRDAESSIVIFSGFVTPRRVAKLGDLLRAKIEQGVNVRCITRPPDRNGSMRPAIGQTGLDMLEGIGCIVDCRANIHEKIAIIDRRIVWHGSLNALSHAHLSDESMTRLASETFASAVAAKMSKRRVGVEKALAALTEPENPRCGDCGGRTVFVEGRRGPFFECEQRCGWTQLMGGPGGQPPNPPPPADLPRVGPPCPECGSQTRLRRSQYGPFYSCSRFPACRGKAQVQDLSEIGERQEPS